jgi:hypothetical protein
LLGLVGRIRCRDKSPDEGKEVLRENSQHPCA